MATIWELRLIKSGDPVVTEVFNNYDQARLAFEEIERKQYPVRAALIERIDGVPAAESPHAAKLRAAGFTDTYKGLTLRG